MKPLLIVLVCALAMSDGAQTPRPAAHKKLLFLTTCNTLTGKTNVATDPDWFWSFAGDSNNHESGELVN